MAEGDFTPYDVHNADEAFLTGTSGSIEPVRDLDGVAIGDVMPGPITGRPMKEWNELAGIDVVAQALRHLAGGEYATSRAGKASGCCRCGGTGRPRDGS